MNVVVINGSPSGVDGMTAQYVKYLERKLPEHRFQVIEVARKIRHIERDDRRFDGILEEMAGADVILWAFPVYVMLVPTQLKRFIELLFERGGSRLAGKTTSSITTSAHHYDHTAHDYMQAVCSDLGMSYLRGFSAGQGELLSATGRRDLLGFARELFLRAAGEPAVDAPARPVRRDVPAYDQPLPEAVRRTVDRKIVLISDAGPGDGNLQRMIELFERSVALPVDRLELRDLRMDGGCLGCMQCADDGRCGYRDDYAAAFDERVRPADIVIFAGAVRDRFLSARMKIFIDRFFSNGHRPVLHGKAMGFLVSGPLQQLATLQEILEAHIEVAQCQRLGIVTDEHDAGTTTGGLCGLARAAERWARDPWFTPPTFRGWAARKNFRDLVYGMRGIMSADHRYYRARGLYDFPQKQIGQRLFMAFLLLLKKIPFLRRRMLRAMRSGHTRAYRRLLESEAI